jgi:hypothetical protein
MPTVGLEWAEWVRRWETRQRDFAELAARKYGYREQVQAEVEACRGFRREHPLSKWPAGQRACDNRGEVDG